MLETREYLDELGRSPFGRWFEKLNSHAALIVRTAIARVESGNLSNAKAVGRGVTEIRIDRGPGYRVYFGREGKTTIILLGGGTKSRQQSDITTAQAYWRDYKNRNWGN